MIDGLFKHFKGVENYRQDSGVNIKIALTEFLELRQFRISKIFHSSIAAEFRLPETRTDVQEAMKSQSTWVKSAPNTLSDLESIKTIDLKRELGMAPSLEATVIPPSEDSTTYRNQDLVILHRVIGVREAQCLGEVSTLEQYAALPMNLGESNRLLKLVVRITLQCSQLQVVIRVAEVKRDMLRANSALSCGKHGREYGGSQYLASLNTLQVSCIRTVPLDKSVTDTRKPRRLGKRIIIISGRQDCQ
ncbi:hypothetical protein SISNIDRAFT_471677 [Sistotremastrum niveocremeum HHB9708]|uniref:Uncharacterized protein n=1 Tax=Sistotremastrum niveocremeum HHB9708 TaxID=1314777 RepID=A0A164MCT8_9AGAM|nr:hypothetical protein SISNIDRAFT_471678 [Sistotremastrum niveocremeum HHB9708]KZS86589.1 hypothetical protein SISNIDRAFT_471677 [Sistotremastrum niveocremeum HHB9708]